MNILVIRMSAMGDVAMTVPVISSFASQNPDIQTTVLTHPRFKEMFPEQENVEIYGADTKKEYKGFLGIIRLFKALIAHKQFDLVIDLHDVIRSKVLRALFELKGVPCHVIKKGRSEKKKLTRAKTKEMRQLQSSIERYCEVFKSAGYEVPLCFKREASELTDDITAITGKKEEKWLAIAPFAQHKGKIYPTEQMAKVIEHFSQKGNCKILLFGGGKQEKEILEGWESQYPNTISIAGKFPLKKELTLLEHADLLISMDSANMHLASLVGTRVLSIWGATHPFAGFFGYGQKTEDALQIDLPCRPCSIYGNKPCLRKDYACMSQITPEMIIGKVEEILSPATNR